MVESNCDQICAVPSEFTWFNILFICCVTHNNTDEFNSVLSVIQALRAKYSPVYMMCWGDFNTDLSRITSGHT